MHNEFSYFIIIIIIQAYACWSGLGTLIVNTIGIVFFHESRDATKLVCLTLIAAGVIGLNLRG
jgi:small multidrug resistance pump